MKLSDLQEIYFKHRGRVIFILSAVFLLAIAAIMGLQRYFTVPEELKLPPFSISAKTGSILGTVDFLNTPRVNPPQSLPAYKAQTINQRFSESQALSLAARFGFNGEPVRSGSGGGGEELWTFSGGSQSLTIANKPRGIIFTGNGAVVGGTFPASSTWVAKVNEFLAAKNLPVDGLTLEKASYLRSGQLVENSEDADFLSLDFAWSVNGRELLGEGTAQTSVQAIFNRQGKVVYLKYLFLDSSFVKFSDVKLISFAQAEDQLKNQGLVVLALPIGANVSESSLIFDLSAFGPNQARLVYVQPAGSDFLYPVYLFEGNGVTSAGAVSATVYLLAVSPEYIKAK